MTDEERNEWYEDMKQEYYMDELEEHKLRTDYDYFISKNYEEVEKLQELYFDLKKEHENYDWEFDLDEVLGL